MVAKLDVDSISIYLDTCTSLCGNLLVRKINAIACCVGYVRDFIVQLFDIDGIHVIGTGLHISNRCTIRTASQGNLCFIYSIIYCVILHTSADLLIQFSQVLCCSIRGFDISTIRCRTYFFIDRIAGNELFGAVCICICNRCIRIGNLTGTECITPSIFVGNFFILFLFICFFSTAVFREIQAYITGTDVCFATDIDRLTTASRQLSILDGIIDSTACYKVAIARYNLTSLDIDCIGRSIAIWLRSNISMFAIDNFNCFFS